MSEIVTSNLRGPGATGTAAILSAINDGPIGGMRNRIINGGMAIDQRNGGAAQTFTAGAALAYSVDRFYAYCTGANVTGQQVQGANVGQFRYQFTGAASVTSIGFGQRIEQLNSADLAGRTVWLSVDMANSLLTTVTWKAYYANTADTFGTLASPTRTEFAFGTLYVDSTVTRCYAGMTVPAAANTGIEIVFTVGAQTSGTWTIGNVQLEPGPVSTPFVRNNYGQELALCQRYYEKGGIFSTGTTATSALGRSNVCYKTEKRATPTVTIQVVGGQNSSGYSILYSTVHGLSMAANGGSVGDHTYFNFISQAEL